MIDLAELYKVQKKFSEAEDLVEKALEQQKLIYGEKNYYVILTTGKLAEIYRLQNKNKKAESLFVKAIESSKCLLGEENIPIPIMLNLAKLYRHQKRCEEEESILLQVLKQQKRDLGKNHRYVFNTKNRLAEISRYQQKGNT